MRLRLIFILILNLAFFSLINILSISGSENFLRQLIFWFVGFLLLVSGLFIDYRHIFYSPYFHIIVALSIISLIIVLFMPGYPKSWIHLGRFTLQTSEFAKLGLFLILVNFLVKYARDLKNIVFLFLILLQVAVFFILLILQPDMGMAFLYFLIIAASLISFLPLRTIFYSIFVLIIIFSLFWFLVLKPYQKERILTFFNLEEDPLTAGYNQRQVKVIIATAGLWGKGIGRSEISKMGFLPAKDTDFILTSLIEEQGLIGFLIYALLIFLLLREISIFNKFITEPYQSAFSYLVFVYLGIKFILTSLINLGIFPIIGLPVPFLSSGGSHLIFDLWLIGILISFKRMIS